MTEDRRGAVVYLPQRLSLTTMREAVDSCRGCDLYRNATRAVFGEGARRAEVMLVGEQPGDQEDIEGRPFVGPAGQLLDRAMAEAGLDRRSVYLTNAVKHFKWTAKGRRRIHSKPSPTQIAACSPWLEAEIAVVQPSWLVALGATAAQTLYGKDFRVTRQRGLVFQTRWAEHSMATLHPSAILRVPTRTARDEQYRSLVGDLARCLGAGASGSAASRSRLATEPPEAPSPGHDNSPRRSAAGDPVGNGSPREPSRATGAKR